MNRNYWQKLQNAEPKSGKMQNYNHNIAMSLNLDLHKC
jgi:hypothetical protein